MKHTLFLLFITTTLLTACGDREEANAKLGRGCEAAVKVMLNKDKYDRQIETVKDKKIGMADGFRLVTLNVVTKNKSYGYENNETFYCKFEESSGPFGLAWKASVVQIKIGDDVYGSEGGELYGTVEDQLALTAAVEGAMR